METSDNRRREREIVSEWKEKSKHRGDYWWFKVDGWTGQGDYIPGLDDGEEPRNV